MYGRAGCVAAKNGGLRREKSGRLLSEDPGSCRAVGRLCCPSPCGASCGGYDCPVFTACAADQHTGACLNIAAGKL